MVDDIWVCLGFLRTLAPGLLGAPLTCLFTLLSLRCRVPLCFYAGTALMINSAVKSDRK